MTTILWVGAGILVASLALSHGWLRRLNGAIYQAPLGQWAARPLSAFALLRPVYLSRSLRGWFHSSCRTQRVTVSGLTLIQAEELLDWLEANGRSDRELTYEADRGFQIRYR